MTYAVSNTIVFTPFQMRRWVGGRDVYAVAGDLGDNSVELTGFYVNGNSSRSY